VEVLAAVEDLGGHRTAGQARGRLDVAGVGCTI
jgi:hypothetical protein